jgi:hypothetical protein
MKGSLLVLVVCSAYALGQTGSCAKNDFWTPLFNAGGHDSQQHQAGDHDYSEEYGGHCYYTTPIDPMTGDCTTHSAATTTLLGDHDGEDMDIWHYLDFHSIAFASANGGAQSNGGTATSDTSGQFGVQSCLINCQLSISLTGAGTGGGFLATFSATPLWSPAQNHWVNSCTPQQPIITCGNPVTCGTGGGTPLIVDTTGKGFDFTDLKHCVLFDLRNKGKPDCYSWPKEGSGNAWLVLDTDADGAVDSGAELFGDFTPHSDGDFLLSPSARPYPANGFTALYYYDYLTGRPNGVVGNKNPIWPKLKLWIDVHCSHTPTIPCSAWRSELHSPEEFGITEIGYVYDAGKEYHDKNGNWFRFWSQTNPAEGERQKPKDPSRELRVSDVWLAQN